tara:strand:+ start:68 stop:490 length:423 start_codon:yes stop_codon:yes gene_type:complete
MREAQHINLVDPSDMNSSKTPNLHKEMHNKLLSRYGKGYQLHSITWTYSDRNGWCDVHAWVICKLDPEHVGPSKNNWLVRKYTKHQKKCSNSPDGYMVTDDWRNVSSFGYRSKKSACLGLEYSTSSGDNPLRTIGPFEVR